MRDDLQADQTLGQYLEFPARLLIGRALAEQGRQVGLHPAIYLFVRTRFACFCLEHAHAFLAELAPHAFNGARTHAQHRGQLAGGPTPGYFVAVEHNLKLTQFGRLLFVLLLPAL
jgi:hypothetical protein